MITFSQYFGIMAAMVISYLLGAGTIIWRDEEHGR